MDLYTEIAAWTGWPPIVALLLLAGSFVLWVLKTRMEQYKEEIGNLKENNPDVLVRRLSYRHKLAMDELERLAKDQEINQEIIRRKETELEQLSQIKIEVEIAKEKLEKANKTLSVVHENFLICPHCSAPLIHREDISHVMDAGGKDIDVDYEQQYYECGFVGVWGYEVKKCPNSDK